MAETKKIGTSRSFASMHCFQLIQQKVAGELHALLPFTGRAWHHEGHAGNP